MILLDQSYWEIKTTKEKGRGLFAKKGIAPGTIVGDYIGKVIKTAEEDTSEKNGLYLMYYHDYASIYPEDLEKTGAHLLNHSCTPNCWVYTYKGHTLFFALRKIHPGEELTISYMLSPNEFCKPCTHECSCESAFCQKTMHLSEKQFKDWNTFHDDQAKQSKRAPIRYGKVLPQLKAYPKTIADDPIYVLFGNTSLPAISYTETTLPTISELRKRIRSTGRILHFPKQKTTIYGLRDNEIVNRLDKNNLILKM